MHSKGFGRGTVTGIHHYGARQKSFIVLKIPCSIGSIPPSLPPLSTPGDLIFFFSLSLQFLHFPLRPIVGLMHYAASQTGFFRLSTCIYVSSMTSRGLKAHSLLSFFFSFSFFCSKVHIIENFSILTTFKFSGLKDISHWSCNHRHHPSPELF